MIIGTEEHSDPGYLSEYKATTGDVFGASFQDAIADNPFTKMMAYAEKKSAGGQRVSKEDAHLKAKEQGVSIGDIPDDGMNSDAIDLLIERQYQKKRRGEVISSAGDGFGNSVAQFSGGLAGSFLDPLNIAMSFIPVVGQAKYASWLAKASGPLARAGIRAGVGAAEGFVGSALLEPANYALSQELGDDYTSADSLMNVAFGTVMGGGLHMGMGAISDAISMKKGNIEPLGPVAKQVDGMDPEVRMEFNRTAIAQAMEDRRIDVTPIKQMQEINVRKQLADIEVQIKDLKGKGLVDDANYFIQQKEHLLSQLDDAPSVETKRAKAIEKVEQEGYKFEIKKDELSDDFGVVVKDSEGKEIGSAILRKEDGSFKAHPFEQIKVDAAHRRKGIASAMYAFAEQETGLKAKPSDSQTMMGKSLWEQNDRPFGIDASDLAVPKTSLSNTDIQRSMQKSATQPNSKFIDENIIQKHQAEFENVPVDMRVEEATKIMEAEVETLKELANQSGVDFEPLMKDANDLVKSADDYGKMLKAMAICAIRKG
jgi:GNAT superfamily N-acetyltransferase